VDGDENGADHADDCAEEIHDGCGDKSALRGSQRDGNGYDLQRRAAGSDERIAAPAESYDLRSVEGACYRLRDKNGTNDTQRSTT
jgi:hypothetical protein